jgi:dipeptidase
MCDTVVVVPSNGAGHGTWFGKNSDREPGEAQIVEHLPAQSYPAPATLRCTYLEIPQAQHTNEIVISRPFWMWGAEMGANARGLVLGNEAVFTRLPVPKTGLTGMDLLRLALERTATAREALELITRLLAEIGQGGLCGYRHRKFRYHNSFILADPTEAWVLETADRYWVAEQVRGVRTISNVLTIGRDFDLMGEGTYEFARRQGWCHSAEDFDFAKAFADPIYRFSSGGEARRACTHQRLTSSPGAIGRDTVFGALRDHVGLGPAEGWRMKMPCAHASWQVTRQSGQTTGSMVSRLSAGNSLHWLTGTSSPCLSVFKPLRLGGGLISTGPPPGEAFDAESLFWRHERLHRLVLRNYTARRAAFETQRSALESEFLRNETPTAMECEKMWDHHRTAAANWTEIVKREADDESLPVLSARYWTEQNRQDRMPG